MAYRQQRGDKGGKNPGVAAYMIERRGPGRGSHIIGCSLTSKNKSKETFQRVNEFYTVSKLDQDNGTTESTKQI